MIRPLRIFTVLVACFTLPSSPFADQTGPNPPDNPTFDLPAHCRLGESCWVVNYVDVDPSPAAKDFRCRARTYNGHDGIDLAIRDRGVMDQGVSVVATARGTVRQVRDGMADVGLSNVASREAIAGRECGNGAVIDHGQGWQTQYCHLKQHSLRVAVGQRVERGSELGLIGFSGQTEFPHVHLTVRHHGQVVDPFTGRSNRAGCGTPGDSLWRDSHVTYEDVALYHAGFSAGEPRVSAIRKGKAVTDQLPAESAALVLWVDIFGVQTEDWLRFQITAPDGRIILNREQRIDRTQARRFAFAGMRRKSPKWPAGTYRGELQLRRGQGDTLLTRTSRVTAQIP